MWVSLLPLVGLFRLCSVGIKVMVYFGVDLHFCPCVISSSSSTCICMWLLLYFVTSNTSLFFFFFTYSPDYIHIHFVVIFLV